MARRGRRKAPRRRRSFSILNALESLIYANIITENVAGANVAQFVLGNQAPGGSGSGWNYGQLGGSGQSIAEVIKDPSLLMVMANRGSSNFVNILAQSFMTGIAFKFGRRLMRRQLSSISRNLIKPALGAGVRL